MICHADTGREGVAERNDGYGEGGPFRAGRPIERDRQNDEGR